MADIVEELQGWREYDNYAHRPGPNPIHCVICGLRFPCDWRMAIDDMAQAAVEIMQLRERLSGVASLGHNDDCMFCGFKDKTVLGEADDAEVENADTGGGGCPDGTPTRIRSCSKQ